MYIITMKLTDFLVRQKPVISPLPCGTYAPASQIGYLLNIFDNVKTINVTVTFNSSYSDIDTLWEGPLKVKHILEHKGTKRNPYTHVKKYFFISEKHESGRYHLHGQCLISSMNRPEEIEAFQNLYKQLSKIGRITLKWNNPDLEVKSDYPTYTHYCLKESNKYTISKNI